VVEIEPLIFSWKERGNRAYFTFMFLNRLRFIKPANKGFIAVRFEICGTAVGHIANFPFHAINFPQKTTTLLFC
jgi:hypothetical protein